MGREKPRPIDENVAQCAQFISASIGDEPGYGRPQPTNDTAMTNPLPTSGIFLSYSNDDADRVGHVHRGLEEHGFDVAWDKMIPPAEKWEGWLKHEIKRARTVLVCATRSALQSGSVKYEISLTRQSLKEPIVLTLDELNIDDLPWGTQEDQIVLLSGINDPTRHENWQKLINSLEEKLRPRWVNRRLTQMNEDVSVHLKRAHEAEDLNSALRKRLFEEEIERTRIKDQYEQLRAQAEVLSQQIRLERVKVDNLQQQIECLRGTEPGDGNKALPVGLVGEIFYEAPSLSQLSHRMIRIEAGRCEITCTQTSINGMPAKTFSIPLELDRALFVGERLISRAEWDAVMMDRKIDDAASQIRTKTNVSMKDATEFVNCLNQRTNGGFYILAEKEWMFIATFLATRATTTGGTAGTSATDIIDEWLSEEWSEYAHRMWGSERAAEKAAGLLRLTRPECLKAGARGHLHTRHFWPADFRSEAVGFRLARRG
jgi:hypothetical protein